MNGPPKMAVLQSQNPLMTQYLGGCSVAIIASPTHAFGIHVARGHPVMLANGSVGYVTGKTPVQMATTAANQLIQLWRQNQAAAGPVKGMVITALEMAQGGDEVADAMYRAIQAAVPITTWNTYSAREAARSTSSGELGVWNNYPNYPTVELGRTDPICFPWS
jgi:hypothetical protein